MSLVRGDTFGRYVVDEVLGAGGGGQVYRAHDTVLHRAIALKVLLPGVDAEHGSLRAQLLREARAAARLNHPNIVSIFDVGEHDGVPYIAMELVPGRALRAFIGASDVSIERRVRWLRDVALALGAAHANGLVHRDVKPENVIVREDGVIKVVDFGIARPSASADPATSRSTETRGVGTLHYMSPEQIHNQPLDGRADQFAWGVTAYELASGGALPWVSSEGALRYLAGVLGEDPVPLRDRTDAIPPDVVAVIERALRRSPDERYSTMDEVADALEPHRSHSGPDVVRHIISLLPPAADLGYQVTTQAPFSGAERHEGGVPDRPSRERKLGARAALVISVGLLGIAGAWLALRRADRTSDANVSPSSFAAPREVEAGHSPVTRVLVLGIENRTSEPVLDGTLEPVLTKALYRSLTLDPVGGSYLLALAEEVDAGGSLDEALGRKLAMAGDRVVTVRGSVQRVEAAYSVSLTAVDSSTGSVVLAATLEAPDAARVVPTMGTLACKLRAALGETVPSVPALAERTGMSVSLEADHEFALGKQLENRDTRASIEHFERAVSLDPEFAAARVALGLRLWSESARDEASTQFKLAFKWIDQMEDRDRLKFLGDYYGTVGENERSISAYQELLQKWPGDVRAAINLSVTWVDNGDANRGLALGRRVALEHPRNLLARTNVSYFCLLVGDFECAVNEARNAIRDFPHVPTSTFLNLGAASALLGRRAEALAAYDAVSAESFDTNIPVYGRMDLAFAEGKLDDAEGLAKSVEFTGEVRHATMDQTVGWTALAQILSRKGDVSGARAAAERALSGDQEPRLLFLAARACIGAGCEAKALSVASRFGKSLQLDERLFGKLLLAEALRVRGKSRDAVTAYEEALHLKDAWLGHLGLARSYLDMHAYPEAYTELQTCVARRGEGAAFWLPSLYLVTPITYYLARAREGIGSPDSSSTYDEFLAMEPEAQHDPLAEDARKRSAATRQTSTRGSRQSRE